MFACTGNNITISKEVIKKNRGVRMSELKTSKEAIPQKNIGYWKRIAPEQIWYCKKCKQQHTPDWNCTHSLIYNLKEKCQK